MLVLGLSLMKRQIWIRWFAALIIALLCSSCLTQRTVSQGGRTVKQSYVMKNPLPTGSAR
jgi:hypothetical protein